MSFLYGDYTKVVREFPKEIEEDKVGDFLGQGLDGAVFEYAEDRVLKITKPWVDQDAKSRLLKILNLANNSKNPHLVKVYSYGISKGNRVWYIMERLDGLNDDEEYTIDLIAEYMYDDEYSDLIDLTDLDEIKDFLGRHNIKCNKYANLVHFVNNFESGSGDFCNINVMKRANKNILVAIDLESFVFHERSHDSRHSCYKY
jgi:hypothetical protein